ncbi:sulfurtransferase [Corynebacterium sp. H127]|uniref:sulfurtransferase n=1 Tax=Corynebacterium sp. H127 TaxID=3133418 RepID=UPI0030ACBBE7
MTATSPLVDVHWLAEHLNDPDLVLFCASAGRPDKSLETAIPGARLADIDQEFSDPAAELPHTAPENVQKIFESHGVSDDSVVVVYDRHGIMYSPRIWWLALAAGLQNVVVLDGGLSAWQDAGFATEPIQQRNVPPGRITAQPREVFARPDDDRLVVDARSAGRFAGSEPEPRGGMRAGHIPGSVNVPFQDLLGADKKFKDPAELERLLPAPQPLLFSCGSGITACIDALAATVVGHTDIKVYDGSWSEWGALNSGKPIESA